MIQLFKITNTSFNKIKQLLVKVKGGKSVNTAEEYTSFGIDSRPLKDMLALYIKTDKDSDECIIGYLQKDRLAEVGETRLFSTDEDGNLQTFVWLKNANNEMHLGGDSNYAVKFNELKTEFNKLKSDFNALVSNYNAHVHVIVGAIPAAPPTSPSASPIITSASPNTSNIDNAKNEKIKTI